jgi:hypothetical protein
MKIDDLYGIVNNNNNNIVIIIIIIVITSSGGGGGGGVCDGGGCSSSSSSCCCCYCGETSTRQSIGIPFQLRQNGLSPLHPSLYWTCELTRLLAHCQAVDKVKRILNVAGLNNMAES